MNIYGTWCTLRVPDNDEDDGYRLLTAISTSFMGFIKQLSIDRRAVEVRPMFMSNPVEDPSDYIKYMFQESILYIDTDSDELELRYHNKSPSQRVNVGDKLIYYLNDDGPDTIHLTDEEYESMLVTEMG